MDTSFEEIRKGIATITVKKINEEVLEDVKLTYSCTKFYKCPNGERVRYSEIKGTGCLVTTNNHLDLCDSQYSNCNTAHYTCEGTNQWIKLCKEVGIKGTLGYGCECNDKDNPENQCNNEDFIEDGYPQNEDNQENDEEKDNQLELNKCLEIIPLNCPGNSELKEERNSNGWVIKNKCRIILSNGRDAEVKIMPENASDMAIKRLGELDFNIELKEGDMSKPVYELVGDKNGRFLGIFKIQARVQALIDAETGEVIKITKPWWSFLVVGILFNKCYKKHKNL